MEHEQDVMKRVFPGSIATGVVSADKHRPHDVSDEVWQSFRQEVAEGFGREDKLTSFDVTPYMGRRMAAKFEAGQPSL